ncbi:MAG: hypothetical protein HYZ89_08200 [Candidatus Omnitrophica bacterium]|nr:hypothetical protein [Candidatus Omnitrophota bacterium]
MAQGAERAAQPSLTHKLLRRQLKQCAGVESLEAVPPAWQGFIRIVAQAYEQADEDRRLLERSLELTSQELQERYETLVNEVAQRKQTQEALRKARDELEIKVLERTAELERSNASLRQEIAERKRTEERLREAHERLRRSHEELSETQAQLIQAEKLAAIGQLASGVAHEVKNPLGIIVQGVDALALDLGLDHGDHADDIREIKAAVQRADRIIHRLLDFARPSRLQPSVVAIAEVMDGALALVAKQVKAAGIEVVRDLRDDLPKVRLDENQMKQVFINLILNAVQAMPRGGRLTMRSSVERLARAEPRIGQSGARALPPGTPLVVSEITDTGEGISEEHLGRVFDPFFTTKPPGQGTGLGLSISRSIVEHHQGLMRLKSRVGEGTTVEILLPLAQGGTDAEGAAGPKADSDDR